MEVLWRSAGGPSLKREESSFLSCKRSVAGGVKPATPSDSSDASGKSGIEPKSRQDPVDQFGRVRTSEKMTEQKNLRQIRARACYDGG